MGCEAQECLLLRRTQRGNELRDLVAVARVAAGDPPLDLVERADECVPGPDTGEPCHGVDGLGEKADVLRGQPARIDVGDDLGGIERPSMKQVTDGFTREALADRTGVAPASRSRCVRSVGWPASPDGEAIPDRRKHSRDPRADHRSHCDIARIVHAEVHP